MHRCALPLGMAHSWDPSIRAHSIHPTPLRADNAQSVPGNARVEQARDAICLDLNETVGVISTDEFRKYLLPDLHSGIDLDAVLEKLRDNKTIEDGRWTLFSVDPRDMVKLSEPPALGADGKPRTEPMHEDAVFKRFEELSRNIHDACISASAIPSSDHLCEFRCNHASIPKSEIRNSLLSRPDSYAVRCTSRAINSQKARVNWTDIVAPGEFKKREDEEDRLDNRRKILWSLYHIMREDVRRRFVFGYTIENRMMRWWYCSRSEVLVTTPFDFIENQSTVVDFVLSIMFANEVQLGWDPTITLLRRNKFLAFPRYEILVRDTSSGHAVERKFRTKDLLWNYGADAFRGRGTRVWSVVEVDEHGVEGTKLLALKEVWADIDREREGRLFQIIKNKVDTCCQDFLREAFNDLFMQPHAFGDVWIDSRAYRTDDFKPGRNGRRLPIIGTLDITAGRANLDSDHPQDPKLPRRGMPEVRTVRSTAITQGQARDYAHKVHHRTVFQNAGKDILTMDTLAEAFKVIAQVFRGLYIMHTVKWVHRDVSYGNVLVHLKSAKITDLEYAKELSDKSIHDGVRTGTPYFMAEEVREMRYLYTPRELLETWDNVPTEDQFFASKTSASPTAPQLAPPDHADPSGNAAKPDQTATVRHNPLHDMESVLWLSFFVLLISEYENDQRDKSRQLLYDPDTFQGFMKAQQELASLLFNDLHARHVFMTQKGFLSDKKAGLHPTVEKILSELNAMRDTLVRLYTTAERNVDAEGHDGLYLDWGKADMMLATHVDKVLAILDANPLSFVQDVSKRRKRPRAPKVTAATSLAADEEKEENVQVDQAQGDGGIASDDEQTHKPAKLSKTRKEGDVSNSKPQQKLSSFIDYLAAQDDSEGDA